VNRLDDRPECIVVGLGIMGSACLHELAKRGHAVLGLDQLSPPHPLGSSHGHSRIIRASYFEHPSYVPLVIRALELWRGIELEAQTSLFRRTGCLSIGPEDGLLCMGARRALAPHSLPFEELDAEKVLIRYPFLRLPQGHQALLEPLAGVLHPERCVQALLALARRKGASLRLNERVLRWKSLGRHFKVATERGTYLAERLLLCVGPWMKKFLPELPLACERQVMFWFEWDASRMERALEQVPALIAETNEGFFYGIPEPERGLYKVARHHGGASCEPDRLEREVKEEDLRPIAQFLDRYMPALRARPKEARVCIYTNTPDQHFIVDHLPRQENLIIISACSGHGFKFAPAIAEEAADLAEGKIKGPRQQLFSLSRFAGAA